jgi:hypothetical protein
MLYYIKKLSRANIFDAQIGHQKVEKKNILKVLKNKKKYVELDHM